MWDAEACRVLVHRELRREQLRQVGNKLFNESSETGEVNFFISHSWKAAPFRSIA